MVMAVLELVDALINRRLHKILLAAEAVMLPAQFKCYRKQVLNEFGKSGLRRELEYELPRRLKDRQG